MKIGIFLPNWIGDVVMATPTVRALRRHFGEDALLVDIMKPDAPGWTGFISVQPHDDRA